MKIELPTKFIIDYSKFPNRKYKIGIINHCYVMSYFPHLIHIVCIVVKVY